MYVTRIPFEHGLIGLMHRQVLSVEQVTVVQALTEALSLGYLRYLDFQRLEGKRIESELTS